MAQRIDNNRALNALLYILEKMGGQCDRHIIYKILYLSDRQHLSKYGRSITSDTYRAMESGPVPSMIDVMFKGVCCDSCVSDADVDGRQKECFHTIGSLTVIASKQPDLDYLSESDLECIDKHIEIFKCMNSGLITDPTHGSAWENTRLGNEMSIKDILREAGDTEDYAEYVYRKIKTESIF